MTNNLGDIILIQHLHSVWKRAGKRASCRDITAQLVEMLEYYKLRENITTIKQNKIPLTQSLNEKCPFNY